MEKLRDRRRNPHNGKSATGLVVFLHGYGADGQDLLSLSDYWKDDLPSIAYAAPDAPFPCEMSPMGRQWFGLQDRRPEILLEGTRKAAQYLNEYLDDLMASYQMEERQIALVGFSQGTMMALHVGLRRTKPFAGILGYSGALIASSLLAQEMKNQSNILLIHGTADEIVPIEAMQAASQALGAAGLKPNTITRPGLGHSIDMEGLMAGKQFLVRSFL